MGLVFKGGLGQGTEPYVVDNVLLCDRLLGFRECGTLGV